LQHGDYGPCPGHLLIQVSVNTLSPMYQGTLRPQWWWGWSNVPPQRTQTTLTWNKRVGVVHCCSQPFTAPSSSVQCHRLQDMTSSWVCHQLQPQLPQWSPRTLVSQKPCPQALWMGRYQKVSIIDP